MTRATLLHTWFALDLRTLALVRIMLGISAFLLLSSFLPLREYFLTDTSLSPRKDFWNEEHVWSLYMLNGSIYFSTTLLLFSMLIAVLFAIGFRTRIMGGLLWVLMCSFEQRVYWAENGGDWYLPLMLIWTPFLPMGAKWSVDALLSKSNLPDQQVLSIATFGLMAQVTCLYVFSGILKLEPVDWSQTGEAIYLVLNSPDIRTPLGALLAPYADLLRALTFYVVYLELLAPVGLYFPFRTQHVRTITVGLLLCLHISFVFLIAIGYFPVVCIAGLCVFITPLVWDSRPMQRFLSFLSRASAPLHPWFLQKLVPALARASTAIFPAYGAPIFRVGLIAKTITLSIALSVLYWNCGTVFGSPYKDTPEWFRHIALSLRLDQSMGFFSPPWDEATQVIIEGQRDDGSWVDLMYRKNGKPKHELRHHSAEYFPTYRWRKYFQSFNLAGYQDFYGEFYCKQFPLIEPELGRGLKDIWITVYNQSTAYPGKPPNEYKKTVELHYNCHDQKGEQLIPNPQK